MKEQQARSSKGHMNMSFTERAREAPTFLVVPEQSEEN